MRPLLQTVETDAQEVTRDFLSLYQWFKNNVEYGALWTKYLPIFRILETRSKIISGRENGTIPNNRVCNKHSLHTIQSLEATKKNISNGFP